MARATQGTVGVVVVAGTREIQRQIMTLSVPAAEAVPCRLVTRVQRDWGTYRPVGLLATHGTPYGQRVSRALAPGESCPVWPLDLTVSAIYQPSTRNDVDLATLLGLTSSDELIISASVEPASIQPAQWLAESVVVPGVGGAFVTSATVPPGARAWRPVVPYGSNWLGVSPGLSYTATHRVRTWSPTDWASAVNGRWLDLPAGGGGAVVITGGPHPVLGAVSTLDLLTIQWRCEQ